MDKRDLLDDAGDAIIVSLAHTSQADSDCPPDQIFRPSLLSKVVTQLRSTCSGLPLLLQLLPTIVPNSPDQVVSLGSSESCRESPISIGIPGSWSWEESTLGHSVVVVFSCLLHIQVTLSGLDG